MIDGHVLSVIVDFGVNLGRAVTGRIQSADGITFMDFTDQSCDPYTFAWLAERGLAGGWKSKDAS